MCASKNSMTCFSCHWHFLKSRIASKAPASSPARRLLTASCRLTQMALLKSSRRSYGRARRWTSTSAPSSLQTFLSKAATKASNKPRRTNSSVASASSWHRPYSTGPKARRSSRRTNRLSRASVVGGGEEAGTEVLLSSETVGSVSSGAAPGAARRMSSALTTLRMSSAPRSRRPCSLPFGLPSKRTPVDPTFWPSSRLFDDETRRSLRVDSSSSSSSSALDESDTRLR
mmetsp:Transcript_19242/g.50065  ORF Transcript_19242/g.50065 Transcript_19242/m.50065 type:complete len:229 (+) Transcript_19242:169-855(+)